MTAPGDDTSPSPEPEPSPDPNPSDPPRPIEQALGFLSALLGIVLVAITPNPPTTVQDWVQIVGGASLTASFVAYGGWYEGLLPWLRRRGITVWGWLQRRRTAVGIAVVLAVALAFGIPQISQFVRGVFIDIAGCSPATQLRMIASPGTATTARQLATSYERWTAAKDHGCPAVDIYVYSGTTDEIRAGILTDGWSDESDTFTLRDTGPKPDIWLATTSHELDGLPTQIVDRTPIAQTPVVLAVPKAVADREGQRTPWADLFSRLTDQGVGIVRADPGSTQLGLLATAMLYGQSLENGPARPQVITPAEVERRIAASLDQGGFPLADTLGLLCRRPAPGSQVAVIASEQDVARFNDGAIGTSCRSRVDDPDRLVALYPSDTRSLDHQFVRLSWSKPQPPQAQAAAEFGAWLRSDEGRDAIVSTSLRPIGPYTVGAGLNVGGIDPGKAVVMEPVPPDWWSSAMAAYHTAQRRGRVLLAVDTSGSMATATPEGTRSSAVAVAVSDALRRMGPRDQFGLWFFPDAPGTGHVEAVPLGPPEYGRLTAARQALVAVRPAGNTPLFRTVVDAAAALGPDDPAQLDAVVVVTDGQDTSSGLGADAVSASLARSGVRLIVVTIGQVRCSDPGLAAVTATAGECFDADTSDLVSVLGAATARLWGGR